MRSRCWFVAPVKIQWGKLLLRNKANDKSYSGQLFGCRLVLKIELVTTDEDMGIGGSIGCLVDWRLVVLWSETLEEGTRKGSRRPDHNVPMDRFLHQRQQIPEQTGPRIYSHSSACIGSYRPRPECLNHLPSNMIGRGEIKECAFVYSVRLFKARLTHGHRDWVGRISACGDRHRWVDYAFNDTGVGFPN